MEQENLPAAPPPGPPPLLSDGQLLHLAQKGWLEIPLPNDITDAVSGLFAHSTSFFDQPTAIKERLFPRSQGTEFGYYQVEHEKEYVTFRCHTREALDPLNEEFPGEFESSTARVWRLAALLLHRILCDISRASDLDLEVWDDMLDGTLEMPSSKSAMTNSLLRVFRYLPVTGHAGEHTDLGLLTLCVGDRPGLQVLSAINEVTGEVKWDDVATGTHSAVVLVGQTLKMLSADALNAGIHRVSGSSDGRNSIVYALRHSSRHPVDLRLFGGERSIRPQELYKEMQVGRVNINAIRDTRDKQRELLEALQP